MKNNQIKTYILAALLFFPSLVLAESVDVTASLPSGTYYAPISIELNTTQPGAKTFYSFKPDGYPQDAYLYTGAILLKKSSPLIFFSIISPTNESKIKQNDYVIEYSPDVHFRDTEVVLGSDNMVDVALINESDKDINIGFYQVQSESSMTEIPEGTMLTSGKVYTVSFQYTGKSPIVFRSPDGEERGILQVVRAQPKPVQRTFSPSSSTSYAPPQETITSTPEDIPASQASPVSGPMPEPAAIASTPSDPVPTPEAVEAPVSITTTPPAETPPVPDIAADIKASASESGTGIQPIYIFSLISFSILIGVAQFWIRKKKNS